MAGHRCSDPIGVGPALGRRADPRDSPSTRPRATPSSRSTSSPPSRREDFEALPGDVFVRGACAPTPSTWGSARQGARGVRPPRRGAGAAAAAGSSAVSNGRSPPRASATTSGSCCSGRPPSSWLAAAVRAAVPRDTAPAAGGAPHGSPPTRSPARHDRRRARGACGRVEVTVDGRRRRRDATRWRRARRCRSRAADELMLSVADGGAVQLTVTARDLGAPGEPGPAVERDVRFGDERVGIPSRRPPRRREPPVRAEVVGRRHRAAARPDRQHQRRWIGERLAEIGVDVLYHQVVGDNLDRIVRGARGWPRRAGRRRARDGRARPDRGRHHPRRDRRADGRADRCAIRRGSRTCLRERFAGFGGGRCRSNNLRQADVPEGARTIDTDRGTAPGLVAELPGGARIYAMPGVPGRDGRDDGSARSCPSSRRALGAAVLRLADAAMRRHRRVAGRRDARATSSRRRRTRASPTWRRRAR